MGVWNPAGGSGGGAVTSVFTRTGAVTAQSGDYTAAQVTGAEATANKGQANGYAGLDGGSLVPAVNSRVSSVFGRTGAVTAQSGDYTASQVTNAVDLTTAQTLTNKRVTARVVTVTQSATPTINTDNTDVASITGLAQAITSMTTNLSGTPVDGDQLIVRITDNGTARAITWGASFEASTVALPTTTVISTLLIVQFLWNTATSKWRCVGVA